MDGEGDFDEMDKGAVAVQWHVRAAMLEEDAEQEVRS
jgi:hypothetical protein